MERAEEERVVDIRVDDHPDPLVELRRGVRVQLAWQSIDGLGPLVDKRDFVQALRLIEKTVDYAPHDTHFRIFLGMVTYLAGREDEGLRHLREARRMDRYFSELWESFVVVPFFTAIYDDEEFVRKVREGQ